MENGYENLKLVGDTIGYQRYCKTVDDLEGSKYARLFTDKELAAMEACEPGQESTVLAGVKDTVEKDEYDKELEDRLYPLYEVELKRRMKKIAEAKKEPSIENMSEYLRIPVNVLELTRKTVRDVYS
ncbi:hypothetical protein PI124_g927 [Phytophthora idaei]|nr:hypothetical protein PI126_g612 [Phytophthora idaei]KAG3254549.1 hypothetical protein PI124_g927 [Phytophthora idaei]